MITMVETLKALGESNRFRIAMMLRSRKLCVCEILEVLDISGATLSNHLKVLKYAGLISGNRQGKWMEYQLTPQGETFVEYLYSNTQDKALLDRDSALLEGIDRNSCSLTGENR